MVTWVLLKIPDFYIIVFKDIFYIPKKPDDVTIINYYIII